MFLPASQTNININHWSRITSPTSKYLKFVGNLLTSWQKSCLIDEVLKLQSLNEISIPYVRFLSTESVKCVNISRIVSPENPRKQLGTSETRYAFFNIKNKNTVATISKTHWKRTHLDVLFSWERTRNLSIHCWCICYVQYCTVRSPGSSIWKRSERVNANNKTTAKGVGPAGAEPTKQKSGCKFMQVTQKVTVSQIPRRPLKMQETFSPPSFLGEVLLLSLLDSTHFPCFIINERFFCVFCICVSSSPLGFQRPRCKTSAAASCTFSQPWKRPRWLRVPTALGKAWWTSWNNILKWRKREEIWQKKNKHLF